MVSTVVLQQEPRPERIDIGDGFVMRWSTRQDTENIADCFAEAFRWENMGQRVSDDGVPGKFEDIFSAAGRMMSGKHVVMSEYDIALVEDTNILRDQPGKNPVVAAISMQQMAGYYGSIDIAYGSVAAVGSLPEYRNRGLIRRLFLDMVHPAANKRGELMTFIIGIPHFYRQFGYEYAVPHKFGRVIKNVSSAIPSLPNAESIEPFSLREVTSADLPYLVKMTTPERLHCNAQLGLYYGQAFWTYIVEVLMPKATENHHDAHHHAGIIVDGKTGQDIGVSLTSNVAERWVWEAFSLDPDQTQERGVTYRDVMPSIIRQLKTFDRPYYECYNAKLNDNILPDESDTAKRERGQFGPMQFSDLWINLTKHHSVTKILDSQGKLAPERAEPLRLYTRIPNLPRWIEKIAPVLEERLKHSAMEGISAKIELDFYRKLEGMSGRGLEIVFKRGKFVSASDWAPGTQEQIFRKQRGSKDKADVSASKDEECALFKGRFAPLTFTRLVTGTLDVSELLHRDSENFVAGGETRLMLEVLFPKVDHFIDLFWW